MLAGGSGGGSVCSARRTLIQDHRFGRGRRREDEARTPAASSGCSTWTDPL